MKCFIDKYLCSYLLAILLVTVVLMVGHARASETKMASATAYTLENCIECHQIDSEESELTMSVDAYEASVHGQEGITCLDCHTGVVDDAHMESEGSGAVDCSECHEQENRHGQDGAEDQRPQCHDCHTKHEMLTKTDPASSVHMSQLTVTCGGCHPTTTGENDYFNWFPAFQIASHNKGDFGKTYDNDNCLGCHQGAGAHGESEPINDQNCYRCHFSADADGALWGYAHPVADKNIQLTTFAAASIYQVFVVIGFIALLGKFLNIVFNRNVRRD